MDLRIAILLFGSFGMLLFLNFPIAAALGISAVASIVAFDLAPLQLLPQQLFSATDSWTLLAVPFFILAGNLFAKTAISERLIRLAKVVVGQFPAGLAMVGVVVSIFFAGISGSGPADTAALGAVLIPGMVQAGYDRRFAAALMAAGGGIGIIIPPSIALLIYGVVANASISKLFIAGILPGVVVGLSLFVVSYLKCGKDPNIRPEKRGTLPEIGAAFKDAFWGLLAPLIILGGIYGGIFTATEAATVAVIYGAVVGFFIHRDLKLADLPEILSDSAVTTGVVMLLVCTASLFAWVLNTSGVAAAAASGLMGLASGKVVGLLLINAILIVAGCFMDAISIFYVFLPILLPVVNALGIDLVHFGVVMTVNMAIGQITPPVGVNLFVACGIAKIPMKEISRAVVPMVAAQTVALLIISFWPDLSLGLTRFMR
ncbi:MAG: C4-dicarboxylate ABC transporter permease [Deltaproteobacteria bacterium]|nr:MAG: C4-dicarboxylate ABC transporter permease [Deltaproteobacteria bacterium]